MNESEAFMMKHKVKALWALLALFAYCALISTLDSLLHSLQKNASSKRQMLCEWFPAQKSATEPRAVVGTATEPAVPDGPDPYAQIMACTNGIRVQRNNLPSKKGTLRGHYLYDRPYFIRGRKLSVPCNVQWDDEDYSMNTGGDSRHKDWSWSIVRPFKHSDGTFNLVPAQKKLKFIEY